MHNELKQQLDELIKNNPVVLFMKGTKERPECGFSKQVVAALLPFAPDLVAVNVLSNPEIREGIKVYSSWPTIPQLYINQEFIGGCDIVLDLARKNELQELLGLKKATQKPELLFSHAAKEAFIRASIDADGDEKIRITINPNFEHDLSFSKKSAADFCYNLGEVEIILDPYSALRAQNLSIDYVTENLDAGFSFDNPNEPKPVQELSVEELKTRHDEKDDFLLLDVRPKFEWDMAHISFAKPMFDMSDEEMAQLKKDHPIVFHCHHGSRSMRIAESFRQKGFTNLFNLTGGIDAWSKRVDKTVPVYTK